MLRTLIVLLSLLVGVAGADVKTDQARAKQLYDAGLIHYNLTEYDAAITAWKESYALSKAPLLLFNLGQAYRLSGNCAKAMAFYDTYEREQPDPKNKAELDQAIALCKNAPVTPDKPAVTPETPVVTPDTPVVTGVTRPVTEKPIVDVVTRPTPRSDSDPGRGKRVAGVVVVATGVLLGGASVYFAIDARSQSRKLDGFDQDWGSKQEAIEAKGERDVKLAWTCGGVGIAAIVAGGVLYYLGGRSIEASAISITPTAGGAQLAWGVTF